MFNIRKFVFVIVVLFSFGVFVLVGMSSIQIDYDNVILSLSVDGIYVQVVSFSVFSIIVMFSVEQICFGNSFMFFIFVINIIDCDINVSVVVQVFSGMGVVYLKVLGVFIMVIIKFGEDVIFIFILIFDNFIDVVQVGQIVQVVFDVSVIVNMNNMLSSGSSF